MAEKMAERFTIKEIEKLYALGYITICADGDIDIIKKEKDEDVLHR